jgi:chromosome segregation ATPase
MKKNIRYFYLLALLCVVLPAFSQKYKTVEDTAKLNKEYVKVLNDIAELNAKLTIAQNDLPGYQAKAKDANDDAATAAAASSDQASKATNGSVKDAKKAKRKANKAYGEAKDSKSAKGKLSDQENKITRYKLDIKKKQQRLEELDIMRTAIDLKIQNNAVPQLQQ